jgi:hypothetical protein
VSGFRVEDDNLVVTLNARQVDGPTLGAKALPAALGVPEALIPLVPVMREATVLDAARAAVVA